MRIGLDHIPEADIIYCAAFFDGEGCVHIAKENRKRLVVPLYAGYVVIVQGERQSAVLYKYQKLFGLGTIMTQRKAKDNWQSVDRWQLSAKAAEQFLRKILPYLIVKKEQAIIFLEYRETFDIQGGKGGKQQTSKRILDIRENCRLRLKEAKRNDEEKTTQKLIFDDSHKQLSMWD